MSGHGVDTAHLDAAVHVYGSTGIRADSYSETGVSPFAKVAFGEAPARLVLLFVDPGDIDRLVDALATAHAELLHLQNRASEEPLVC